MSETSLPPGLGVSTNGSAANGDFSLKNILGENHEAVQHLAGRVAPATGWDEEDTERPLEEGYCVECEGNIYSSILTTKASHLTWSSPVRSTCRTVL